MDKASSFGAWLRRRRKALDLTQAALAELVGYSVSAIRKLEADELRPSRESATRLAPVLGVADEERAAFLRFARAGPEGGPAEQPRTPQAEPVEPLPRILASSIADPPAPQTNLPPPAAPCIGREEELALIASRLADPFCRLLTVNGPGGIGKTRLALEAAALHVTAFPDGVYLVSLAAVNASSLLAAAIADALGLRRYSDADAEAQLLTFLRERQMLLLLDNFEHLIDGTRLLARILDCAPAVKLLVTSRERLNLLEEWLVPLDGLRTPEDDYAGEDAAMYGAVALFVERAARVQPGFSLSPEVQPAVLRICRLVRGLPLGIELAAAWVRLLPCAEIANEIVRSLDVLTTSARNVPDRQRSLRAAFVHSWALLSEAEQAAFARLAVFQGGFRREAAEQVAGASLAMLSALMDKSLLYVRPSGRYELHEALRQYAGEKLAVTVGKEAIVDRHSAYYLAMLGYRMHDRPAEQIPEHTTLAAVVAELDNVRAAWGWAAAHQQVARLRVAIHGLAVFYQTYGLFAEGVELVRLVGQWAVPGETDAQPDPERAALGGAAKLTEAWFSILLRRLEQAERCMRVYEAIVPAGGWPDLEANYLLLRGMLAALKGPYAEAHQPLLASIAIARETGQGLLMGFAFHSLGMACLALGQLEEARQYLSEGLSVHRAIGHQFGLRIGLLFLGDVARTQGDPQEAHQRYDESRTVSAAVDDRVGVAVALIRLGALAQEAGSFAEAERRFRESLEAYWSVGYTPGMATALGKLGRLAYARGDLVESLRLHQASLARSRESGSQRSIGTSLVFVGLAACALGEYEEARRSLAEALRTAYDRGAEPLALDALGALGELAAAEGRAEQAIELLAVTLHHSATPRRTRERAGQQLDDQVERLPAASFEAMQKSGQHRDVWVVTKALLAEIEARI